MQRGEEGKGEEGRGEEGRGDQKPSVPKRLFKWERHKHTAGLQGGPVTTWDVQGWHQTRGGQPGDHRLA